MIGPFPPNPAIFKVVIACAEYLGVRQSTVLEWARSGRLVRALEAKRPIDVDALHRGEASG